MSPALEPGTPEPQSIHSHPARRVEKLNRLFLYNVETLTGKSTGARQKFLRAQAHTEGGKLPS